MIIKKNNKYLIHTPGTTDTLTTGVTGLGYLGQEQLRVGVAAQTLQQSTSLSQQSPAVQHLSVGKNI